MTTQSVPAARVRTPRWSPGWAKALLAALTLPFLASFLFGIYLVQSDLAIEGEWLDGLGVALGAAAMGATALAVLPSLVFWFRGGRVLYWCVFGWQALFLLVAVAWLLILGMS